MSEFRQDPVTGRWAIVAESRAARPNEYGARTSPSPAESCPFCPGHESWTPSEVGADREAGTAADGPGWRVRAIPNKFPSLSAEARTLTPAPATAGEARRSGWGMHEVVVATPRHGGTLGALPSEQVARVLRVLRDRVRVLSRTPGVAACVAFENSGPESGGTLYHPHLQVVAVPDVPPRLREESEGLARFSQDHGGRCGYEWVAEGERDRGVRVVREEGGFLAFAPFASEHPYEVRFFPARHAPSFGEMTESELLGLAGMLPKVLRALDAVVPGASYNLVSRAFDPDRPEAAGYHWHLDLLPRLVRADGFELGDGTPVNPVAPEGAAEALRAAADAETKSPPRTEPAPKS